MRLDWRIRNRLVSLAGLVLIVGVALGALSLAGVLGRPSGGRTETGKEILPAEIVETPPSADFPSAKVAAEEGALAPDFEVSDFEGNRVRLSEFRGKAVFLDFWATWCTPCLFMLPEMHEFQRRHEAEGLVIVSVNRGETLSRAKNFLEKIPRKDGGTGVMFTLEGLDPTDEVFRKYRAIGMPFSVFIDEDGVIRLMRSGLITQEQMEKGLEITRTRSQEDPGRAGTES